MSYFLPVSLTKESENILVLPLLRAGHTRCCWPGAAVASSMCGLEAYGKTFLAFNDCLPPIGVVALTPAPDAGVYRL